MSFKLDRYLRICGFVVLFLISTNLHHTVEYVAIKKNEREVLLTAQKDHATCNHRTKKGERIADRVVKSAFDQTFGVIDKCPLDKAQDECLEELLQKLKSDSSEPRELVLPWWYHTMLREASTGEWRGHSSAVNAPWHFRTNGRINFCVIEKNGSKQWRRVFDRIEGGRQTRRWSAIPNEQGDNPLVVFLRDPLERFLSGYLDKCENRKHRIKEHHCKPEEIFGAWEESKFIGDLDQRGRFEAYVDAMPLYWNLHFFPQHMYCSGLHRYRLDFIGSINSALSDDIRALDKYGKDFSDAILHEYGFLEKGSSSEETAANDNGPHFLTVKAVDTNTKAAEKVKSFYSPQTVRRVLEYMSGDYVLLNLSIPDWACEMLEAEG